MPTPRASEDFYRTVQRLELMAVLAGRRAWSRMGADFDSSWRRLAPPLVEVTAAAQLAAASAAVAYVPAVLAETGQPDEPEARVRPRVFAGVASDGRSLEGLLAGSVAHAKQAARGPVFRDGNMTTYSPGAGSKAALAAGGKWLDSLMQSAVADAARDATAAEIVVRPNMGWTRMVNPPCCSRCAVLAGAWYRWNQGFQRHPNCFPAGVTVSGPGHSAAARRWYDGELVVLTTASGQNLPLTGNHPVLTSRGWVPANLLEEGDDVVRATATEGARGLVVPDHHEVPSRIEDVWDALSVTGFRRVPTSPEDFHGDGQHGHVDVVGADGSLWNQGAVRESLGEQVVEGDLARRVGVTLGFNSERPSELVDFGHAPQSGSSMSLRGLSLPLLGRHLSRAHRSCLAGASTLNAGRNESLGECASADVVLAGERQFAGAGLVRLDDLSHREFPFEARWDAPGEAFSVETRGGYASRGLDLLDRLAGQVELDRVVDLRRVQWSGHVYSLTSVEGWHAANSLIVSNCDCTHIPTVENIADNFKTDATSLAGRGLITDLTKAQRQRIDDGADLNKVLNESRDRWRERMAADRAKQGPVDRLGRRRQNNWGGGDGKPLIPPGGTVQDLMANLTADVERRRAVSALRDASIAN